MCGFLGDTIKWVVGTVKWVDLLNGCALGDTIKWVVS